MENEKKLSDIQEAAFLSLLKARLEKCVLLHHSIEWARLLEKLKANSAALWSLNEMELTGGEPNLVDYDLKTDTYTFFDCSAETPKERRSICYDPTALAARKENKPAHSAVGMATEMGIELLTETQYRYLQSLGKFDTKTSSWLLTPSDIRKLGGAIFGDRRYDTVFVYHNGAESYYAGRGFRGVLIV